MSDIGIGVIEGFFGPEWSWQARHHFCENLSSYGGSYYIYAPKRDSFLRKNWIEKHPLEIWQELKNLGLKCHENGISFGIGLSPFEIHDHWNNDTKKRLTEKIKSFEELNPDYLGIFFDDMKGSADLAEKQIEVLELVTNVTKTKIFFCPTYYSHDPILDKVFGQRPEGYLEKISTLPEEIEIFWTGNKVIPKSIAAEDLVPIEKILKRKPFIWENYFANDGPKQCKFLKLLPLEGRLPSTLQNSSGWAFNLMNQPRLSELVFAASVQVLKYGVEPTKALEDQLIGLPDSAILKNYRQPFAEQGLDRLDDQLKSEIKKHLSSDPSAAEVRDWLNGKYIVGAECLTD